MLKSDVLCTVLTTFDFSLGSVGHVTKAAYAMPRRESRRTLQEEIINVTRWSLQWMLKLQGGDKRARILCCTEGITVSMALADPTWDVALLVAILLLL